jgi:uncharacterized membrane protein YbhN (UPF0104 family)
MRRLRLAVPVLGRVLVPVAVLALVWHLADGPAAAARLAAADPRWLAAGLALLLAQTALSALRWARVSAAMGQPLPLPRALREGFVAQLLNQTLPGGVPGEVARALRVAPPGGLATAAAAVATERAMGQAGLFAVLLAGLAGSLAWGRIGWPGWAVPVALALGLGAAAAVALAGPLRRAARAACTGPGGATGQAALSLGTAGLNLLAFAAAARATGSPLPAEAVAALVPLILTAMLIPATIAGWGWREGAAAALFPLAGLAPAAGVAASAAFGALVLAAALPGALWLNRPPRAGLAA